MLKRLRKEVRQRLSRLSFLLRGGWRGGDSPASLKSRYSEAVRSRLKTSKHTASLGANLRGEEFEDLGKSLFAKLKEYGLRPNDVCVDYGCGTLRVGRHVITYLKPGGYWGLDIDQFLLDEGRNLLGEALWEEKRPNLRVISPQSVADAAAAKPAMLFSAKVLSHVHPDEVAGYVANLLTIIGTSGQAIVMSRWSEGETFQCNKWMWAHSLTDVGDIVARQGAELEILANKSGVGKNMRSGLIRIVSRARVASSGSGQTKS